MLTAGKYNADNLLSNGVLPQIDLFEKILYFF